jgi:hypothetical protein
MFVLDGETVRVEGSSKGCSLEALAELQRLAMTHIRSVSDTVERLNIPIGKIAAER